MSRASLVVTSLIGAGILAAALAACNHKPAANKPPPPPDDVVTAPPDAAPPEQPGPPTADDARAFIAQVDRDLRASWSERDLADWARATNITEATEAESARLSTASRDLLTRAILDARRFAPVLDQLDPATRRQFQLLRTAGITAPSDPTHAAELSKVMTSMESAYSKGKVCHGDKCQNLGELTDVMAESRDPAVLLAAWQGWRDAVGRQELPLYRRFVELGNEGVKVAGFDDISQLWLSRYDMPPAEMVAEADRLWGQVEPLYKDLHCYVRRKLSVKYGKKLVPLDGPIPAHLLGNMWAQSWSNIYPMVEPYRGQPSPDVSKALVAQGYDPVRMTKLAESFFTSLGLKPLPDTFWQRSMLSRPADKEVECHASAWDPTYSGDVRIKMCIKPNQDDLITIHHELGHDYYYLYYHQLPILFQDGANDGFHEAIGDTIALSVTPSYLEKVGLLKKVARNDKALIDQQMFVALDKVAFLPFGLLVDKWRWEAFDGSITPAQWNDRWWELRRQYQGIAPPVARTAADFDPGAKYHVPNNTPYLRYFLAFVLQFQFHRALCQEAGWKGPLHECSIHGSKEAGERLAAMLALGSSKPWPDALEALTGQRDIDATAIVDYFGPLHAWLKKQNRGQQCGW